MNEAERLPLKDMPELEQWILHRLSEMDTLIRADIKNYDYNHMVQELHTFCANDLSAFYFDVRKDSLYCDTPSNPRRRAARTVMEIVFDHLVVWLAPILCFTAEEAYLARHTGTQGSVHLLAYPTVPEAWRNPVLAEKWSKIRELRRVVTGAMEIARNEKKIGSSLQASPQIHAGPEQQKLLKSLDFAEVCISAPPVFNENPPSSEAFSLPDVPGISVVVGLAQGQKCDRCWQVLPEVGQKVEGLCPRCAEAIAYGKKK